MGWTLEASITGVSAGARRRLTRSSNSIATVRRIALLTVVLALAFCSVVHAEPITVVDDAQSTVRLPAAARRIVSLAPHITELLFAVGAGKQVVGTVAHSDFPAQALDLQNVGTYDHPNIEAILRLAPDLVVAWQSGTPPQVTDALKSFGIPVFTSQPKNLDDVPRNLLSLGTLTGTSSVAARAAENYRHRVGQLTRQYGARSKVRTFYEVWNRPLMSIGGQHIINAVLDLCGAENIFADLTTLAPTIDLEAVLAANPEVILASGMDENRPEWLDDWREWKQLDAVKNDNLYFVPPDIIQRHTPRILDGAELICRHIDAARRKRRP